MLKKKNIIHIVSWLVLYVLVSLLVGNTFGNRQAFVRHIVLFIVIIPVFYINLKLLMPNLLEKRRYLLYGLSVLALAIVATLFARNLEIAFIENGIIESNFRADRVGERHRRHVHGRFILNAIIILITLFVSTVVRNTIQRQKKEQELLLLQNQALEAESKFLKSQINPHFLFNALNNIYALTQLKSDKAPESVHKLSDILRYVIYDSDVERVPLNKEIQYLKSFIELNLLKDDTINVKYSLPNVNGGLKIAPMLLIPFIENAFKHSYIENTANGWIKMDLKVEEDNLVFSIENSLPTGTQRKDELGGVGLANIKKRLALIYKGKYLLHIKETGTYKVELKIDLNEA